MNHSSPIVSDLVLAGGGHSHALVLRMLAMEPIGGLQVTLVSDHSHVPYSGMLHGYITGYYSYDDSHIDIRRLSSFAGVRYLHAAIAGIDTASRRLLLAGRPSISYDLLSINIGSTPRLGEIRGAKEFAVPVKPVPALLHGWQEMLDSAAARPKQPFSFAVVGGGAGGTELCLAMHRRLTALFKDKTGRSDQLTAYLIHNHSRLLETHENKAGALMLDLLRSQGVKVLKPEEVIEIDAAGLCCESGTRLDVDAVICATGAEPPKWLAESGLALDARGFISVGETLQSVSHPEVFAAGDIASLSVSPRPKAGVFAVRQGKPLYENLKAAVLDRPLQPYAPQKEFLSLISSSHGSAVASRGSRAFHSRLLWPIKDYIDRRFIRRFSELPVLNMYPASHTLKVRSKEFAALAAHSEMRCLGCAAKVGASALHEALGRLRGYAAGSLLEHAIGFEGTEDAAVLPAVRDKPLLQTIDYFPALIADPEVFGRIAVQHAFNDIFAMGAEPLGALALAVLPYSGDRQRAELLFQALAGALASLQEIGAQLYGGHSAEGEQLALGFACSGQASGDTLLEKRGMQPGDALILNKALGTGVLFAADMRHRARGRWVDAAIESMLQSNQHAARLLRSGKAHALTDVTGFGLLGHLREMLPDTGIRIQLDLDALRTLPGAVELFGERVQSTLHAKNKVAESLIENPHDFSAHLNYPLLFDPQTSGGLLAALPRDDAGRMVSELHSLGYNNAVVFGYVESAGQAKSSVALGLKL